MTASLSARISTPPGTGTRLPSASDTRELTKEGLDAARAARLRLPTPMFNAPWAFPRAMRSRSRLEPSSPAKATRLPAASSTATVIGGKSLLRACARARTTIVRAAPRLIAVPNGFDIVTSKRRRSFLFEVERTPPYAIAQPIVFVYDAVMPRLSAQTRPHRRHHLQTSGWTRFSRDG